MLLVMMMMMMIDDDDVCVSRDNNIWQTRTHGSVSWACTVRYTSLIDYKNTIPAFTLHQHFTAVAVA